MVTEEFKKEVEYARKIARIRDIAEKELPCCDFENVFIKSSPRVHCYEGIKLIIISTTIKLNEEKQSIFSRVLNTVAANVFGEDYKLLFVQEEEHFEPDFIKYYLIQEECCPHYKEVACTYGIDHPFAYIQQKWQPVERTYIEDYIWGIDRSEPEGSPYYYYNNEIMNSITEISKKRAEQIICRGIDEEWFFDQIINEE